MDAGGLMGYLSVGPGQQNVLETLLPGWMQAWVVGTIWQVGMCSVHEHLEGGGYICPGSLLAPWRPHK